MKPAPNNGLESVKEPENFSTPEVSVTNPNDWVASPRSVRWSTATSSNPPRPLSATISVMSVVPVPENETWVAAAPSNTSFTPA